MVLRQAEIAELIARHVVQVLGWDGHGNYSVVFTVDPTAPAGNDDAISAEVIDVGIPDMQLPAGRLGQTMYPPLRSVETQNVEGML